MHLVMRYLCFFGIVKRQGVKRRMDKRSTSEEQKSGYLGLTRADEERHLADVISVAQQNLERAGADIRKVNEDLADLLETYDVKDKEGLALWNNATARLKENEYDLIRYEKARKSPTSGELILRTASPRRRRPVISEEPELRKTAQSRWCWTGERPLHRYITRAAWDPALIR